MSGPKRIQRKRTKGWRMPGGAVYVGRGSQWGNPYKAVREGGFQCVVDPMGRRVSGLACSTDRSELAQEMRLVAVECFAKMLPSLMRDVWQYPDNGAIRAALAGKDLACWCPLDQPCHADVLLEIANRP